MKKAIALVVSGSLLLGSAAYVFGLEGNQYQVKENTQEDPIVITLDLENEEDIDMIQDIKDLLFEKIEAMNLNEEELEEFIEKIIEELEKELKAEENHDEATEEDKKSEVDTDDEKDHHEDKDNEEKEDSEEEELEKEQEKNSKKILTKLYKKILHYQRIYDKVPDVAKPAIKKNIRKVQLQILSYRESMQEGLKEKDNKVLEEELQRLIAEIKELNEKNKLIEFIEEHEDWQQPLRKEIQQQFLIEKKEQVEGNKAKKTVTKEENQKIQEAFKKKNKEKKEVTISAVKKTTNEKNSITHHKDNNENRGNSANTSKNKKFK